MKYRDGFGSSAKMARPAGSGSIDRRNDIFLPRTKDQKRGMYLMRLVPMKDRVVRQFWLAKEPDGRWVPKPAKPYDPTDKRMSIPVTVAVFDPTDGDYGSWKNYGNPWDNAVTRYLDALDLPKAERDNYFPKEVFYASIIDVSPTKMVDGKLIYPDTRGQFDAALKSTPTVIQRTPRVLTSSAGKVYDTNGDIVGKNAYAQLLSALAGEFDPVQDRRLLPHEYTVRMVISGQGTDTAYKFASTSDREEYDWDTMKVYDIPSWVKVTPDEVIEALLEGADWNELIKLHNLELYPQLITMDANEPDTEITEDDIPF